jgi:hypothetical protein
MGRQVRKIRDFDGNVAELGAHMGIFLMRPPKEIFEQSKLVHDFERCGVNRIPAKISQKIAVLFENDGFDACSGKQKTQNYAGGTTASYAALGVHSFNRLIVLVQAESPWQNLRLAVIPFGGFAKPPTPTRGGIATP